MVHLDDNKRGHPLPLQGLFQGTVQTGAELVGDGTEAIPSGVGIVISVGEGIYDYVINDNDDGECSQ